MANTDGMSFLLALGLGTFAMLVLVLSLIAFIYFHQRRVISHQVELRTKDEEMQREMLRATIQTQEEEQRRIARDLHDELGPMLSAVKLKVSQLKNAVKQNEAAVTEIEESKEMLNITISQVRGISHRLLPPILEDYGLVRALESMCSKINTQQLEVIFEAPEAYARIDNGAELALYRVVMELINNIIRHSGATIAHIIIKQTESGIFIFVEDNGKGFDTTDMMRKPGLGLKNIQSRLKAINAVIDYKSSGAGTTASISLNKS
ncbi:MAG TPA: sensor histidine kinase [Chitinophagales bacterium]|nr:sensor histidine kinase [Chitinophagales bacterium]